MSHLPNWIKFKIPDANTVSKMNNVLCNLHTVCQSAKCPNIGECFSSGTATFMILGNVCTRNCRFCAVNSILETSQVLKIDSDEPNRVADAVKKLSLKYAVITSVTRDDLPDGGATHFADTIKSIKEKNPDCKIEVLIPDFKGEISSLKKVLDASPDVLNHNIETVSRLYPTVRPQANYNRSLNILKSAKDLSPNMITKSGMMVGLGETKDEIISAMNDLLNVHCDILTIGQYLQPTKTKLPVSRFISPDEFAELKRIGEEMGFMHIEAGPLVRSSYKAELQILYSQRA